MTARSMNLTSPRTSLVNAERKRHQTRRAYKKQIEEDFDEAQLTKYDGILTGAEPADDAFQVTDAECLDDARIFISLSMNPALIRPQNRIKAAETAVLLAHIINVSRNFPHTSFPWDESHLSHLVSRINPNRFRQDCVTAEFHESDVIINYTPIYDSEECVHLRMPSYLLPVVDGLIVNFFRLACTLGDYSAFTD